MRPSPRKYFGTDGVRTCVGTEPMTPQTVLKMGWAAGKALAGDGGKVLVGKDTRISGYMFESSLEAGLSAAGMDILLLGPLPTPAIAYLAKTFRVAAGVVISASHNSYQDNGIKFFSNRGVKLSDKEEAEIERWMEKSPEVVAPDKLGKAHRVEDAAGRYIEFCKSTVPEELTLDGLNLVVDCAHGAGYATAPHVYEELGAKVHAIGVEPDGFNINEGCGATAPAALQREVRERRADFGIAMDGDGDRLIMVDERGDVVDGDELLAIIAVARHEKGVLQGGVVGTQMSNVGLEKALAQRGIPFARSLVGDRHVLQMLEGKGWLLGGEASGHIICFDKLPTGDAVVSSLQVIASLGGRPLSEARKVMTRYPQVQVNVPLDGAFDAGNRRLVEAIVSAKAALDGSGQVVVRPSGTEPLVRVMVEAESRETCGAWAGQIAEAVRTSIKT